MLGLPSEVGIVAGKDSTAHCISCHDFNRLCEEHCPDFVKSASDALFRMVYTRYLDSYRKSPKERYIAFIRQYPDILQVISLKELASYLHITPIYLSRLRKEVHSF